MQGIEVERLRRLAEQIFVAAGASSANAERVADALVEANLAGHDSHGVQHIPGYVGAIRDGTIVPDATPEVLRDAAATALVSGNWTFGHVAAHAATEIAIAKAKVSGVAAVGLVRLNHIGRLGEYAEMAARAGVVAMVAAGGFAEERGQAVPYGGARPALGTNPIAMGFPGGERPAMVLDFATTAIAAGKIAIARTNGQALPANAIIDHAGQPSTDPNAYFEGGALLPFGGHKGYALSMAVEFLGRVLTGSEAFAAEGHGGPYFARSGATIVAIDPAQFGAIDQYCLRADAAIDRIKSVPPAPGFAEVLVPGEPEHRTRQARLIDGIPVPDSTWQSIRDTAVALGLEDPGAV